MKNNKKFCITFAGAVGSSKTPIANFLSTKLNLPVFNNDAVRSEVIEDFGSFDPEEHIKRRNLRFAEILESGISFINDSSVDRKWEGTKKKLVDSKYEIFIISLNLSKELLIKIHEAKKKIYETSGNEKYVEQIDKYLDDHGKFLREYKKDVNLHISDDNFKNRFEICHKEISEWIKSVYFS